MKNKVIKPKVTRVSSSSDNRNPRKISFKTKIKRVYAKHRQKLLKTIPILGLLYLLVLFLGDGEGEPGIATNQLSTEQLWEALEGLVSSFKFGDPQTIIITVVTAIVIWTGYKYWLLQLRVFRRKQQITERLVFAFIAFVFINNHIKVNSPLGRFVDWAILLIFLYLVLAGTWLGLNFIDSINMRSDLNVWSLRLVGLVTIGFGVLLFTSSTFALAVTDIDLIFNNIYWIGSLCIIGLGAFMEYRSVRREPAIYVWR